jgi:glycosyltransferase involved in cell wall biosynthesis
MARIKSTYELACERIIVPKKKEKYRDPENDDDFEMPEFVECWKHPDGPQEYQTIVLEDDGSNGTESMIRQYDPLKGNKPIVEEEVRKEEVKDTPPHKIKARIQESYRVNMDLSSNPSVHWYGHFTSYAGFSRMNRAFAFKLANRGIRVRTDIQKSSVDVNESTAEQLNKMSQVCLPENAPKVFGATVPLSMFHQGKKILFTMMETSCTLHPDYVGKLNLFDEIWVPTEFAKKMFKQNGVHPSIHVMPLGVDVKRYNPDRKVFNFQREDEEEAQEDFVFLSVFKWGYRKGYDVLLKAFMEEFSWDDRVRLLLVSRSEAFNDPDQIVKDFSGVRQSINKKDEDLPAIDLYDKEISEKDMPNIYGAADAFCLISRGEGFGLPYCEAGASGLPVIASNCSGHSDFLNESNSFLVEPEGYTTAQTTGHMSKLAKHCRFYEDQQFPEFGRDAIEQTKKHMRYVYENYESSLEKAKQLRQDMVENYTWDKAVDRVYKRVLELNGVR